VFCSPIMLDSSLVFDACLLVHCINSRCAVCHLAVDLRQQHTTRLDVDTIYFILTETRFLIFPAPNHLFLELLCFGLTWQCVSALSPNGNYLSHVVSNNAAVFGLNVIFSCH